jgi:hypothetical protein
VALAANPGRVLTREAMLHLVYGDDPRIDIHSQALNVHVSHVRQKLGCTAWLGTVTGIGFRVLPTREAGELPSIDKERVREQRRELRLAWARGSAPTVATGFRNARGDDRARARTLVRLRPGAPRVSAPAALCGAAAHLGENSRPRRVRVRVEVVDLQPAALAKVHHLDCDEVAILIDVK